MPITEGDVKEFFKAVPVEPKATCPVCEKPIDASEKIMMQLAIKVPLLPKVKKNIHRACAQPILSWAEKALLHADLEALDK